IMAYRMLGAYSPQPARPTGGGGSTGGGGTSGRTTGGTAGGGSGGPGGMGGRTRGGGATGGGPGGGGRRRGRRWGGGGRAGGGGGGGTPGGRGGSTGGGNTGGGNSGGGGNQRMEIPEVVINSPSPITSQQIDMNGRPRQSISSLFGLVNAKVAVTRRGSMTVIESRTTGPGGTNTNRSTSVTPTVVTVYNSPFADPANPQQFRPVLLDKCTTRKDAEIPARVNVNTAPLAVLSALPGMTDTDIQTIQGRRPPPAAADWADPIYQTPAWLLT